MNSRLYWTFAITSLALFAFTLDRLVVAIALPAIRTDLGAQAEQGQASGAATAIRELAVVFGVAVLGQVFAGHGGYASRADFTAGFVPALWLAAGLAAAGLLAAVALPHGADRRRTRGPRALTDPLARCDNDARDAVSAGAAG